LISRTAFPGARTGVDGRICFHDGVTQAEIGGEQWNAFTGMVDEHASAVATGNQLM